MKKVLLMTALFAVTLSSSFAQKSDNVAPKNVIKVNPLGLLIGQAGLSYERALNAKSSVQVSGLFGGYKLGDYKYSNFGGGLEYRFYFGKDESAPKGFYAAPGVAFFSGKTKYDVGSGNTETNFTNFSVKGIVGKQWIWKGGFSLDLNIGVAYRSYNYTNSSGVLSGLKANGVTPAFALALGYAF